MARLINLVKSDIPDQQKQLMLFKITEFSVQEGLNKHSDLMKNPKKEALMKKQEVRDYICEFLLTQLHKGGYHNLMVILARDFNISLKYKKQTLMRFYLPGEYIMMIYESPHISKCFVLSNQI
jgi:hypothetical protein